MPLKKYKLSKKSRKMKKNSKSSKSSKSRKYRKNRSSRKFKTTIRQKNRSRSRKIQKGGKSCSLATVQEPGFSINELGSMPGLSIAGSTAAIYRPNCSQNSSSQAMVPL